MWYWATNQERPTEAPSIIQQQQCTISYIAEYSEAARKCTKLLLTSDIKRAQNPYSTMRPFPSSPRASIRTRLSAQPLIWKLIFILMQIREWKELKRNCSPIGHNNTKHFWCPIRSRHPLEVLEIVRWESVPRGSFARTWKLSSRPLSRPDWLPLGLLGCPILWGFEKGYTSLQSPPGQRFKTPCYSNKRSLSHHCRQNNLNMIHFISFNIRLLNILLIL